MEGKGPYRIYDPGGGEAQAKVEVEAASYQQLLEENNVLRERMKGLKSLGDLLEESQTEASKLRQRVEELVKDNEALRSSSASFSSSVCVGLPVQTEAQAQGNDEQPNPEPAGSPNLDAGKALRPESSEGSSEFEVVNLDGTESGGENVKSGGGIRLPQETTELTNQLQKLESSFNVFTEESNPNQLMAHLGRMALEFNHLSSKVQKNEQRTSLLQTLCEQLRNENNELRKKMEDDLRYRNEDMELLRQENVRLKKLVTTTGEPMGIQLQVTKPVPVKPEPVGAKMEVVITQQSGKAVEKSPTKTCDPEVYEKKIKMLEKQRKDVLEVNKQWDIQWNSMKLQFEQKITDLRQRLADSQKAVLELEAEREQKQRDYDKKLLLAKSKIETVQGEKECLTSETCELKHKLRYMQDQLLPLSKQKEYQDKEIQRLNRALEEALNLHSPSSTAQQPGFGNHGEGAMNLRRQDLLTQIAVLKEQVKIFEEDFQKERSDRERMNEEKEDLRRQVERFQGQITNLTNQLHQAQSECQRERTERCKLERLHMHLKQGQHERRTSDPTSGSANAPISPPYCGPFVQAGHQGFDGWPVHFPPRIPNLSVAPGREFPPFQPGFAWQPPGPQQRGARGAGDSARPPPENTDPTAGFGKRDRQNIDPGKH